MALRNKMRYEEKEMKKEGKEHPEFGKSTIKKIVKDHERMKGK